jgi:hypothetical protein
VSTQSVSRNGNWDKKKSYLDLQSGFLHLLGLPRLKTFRTQCKVRSQNHGNLVCNGSCSVAHWSEVQSS